ncbi:MAG TPA: glycoside hydrolase domain-containing protein, partial [Flavisolibacter sp.]|nr:glycoside hydrolase domain-containing protein [Flavisolibacter sp.]
QSRNRYVQSVSVNGKTWNKNYLRYTELMKGGTVHFTMGATPNKTRGTAPEAYPYSLSLEKAMADSVK